MQFHVIVGGLALGVIGSSFLLEGLKVGPSDTHNKVRTLALTLLGLSFFYQCGQGLYALKTTPWQCKGRIILNLFYLILGACCFRGAQSTPPRKRSVMGNDPSSFTPQKRV